MRRVVYALEDNWAKTNQRITEIVDNIAQLTNMLL
jgi:predicted oxidoreductase (fatty acid repression mutant protein)